MSLLKVLVGVITVIGLGSPSVWAYEEINVENGGTIQGKVTLAGGKPRPMAF